jgi:hypothetical protein
MSMSFFFKHRLAVLSISAILSACGGGGGDNSSVAPSGASTLSGAVIDGYLKGATVCLDLNTNLACDSTEPTTKSLDKGAYSLSVPAGTDASNLHVIAIVDSNTIDADTGKAPDKGYTLMAPANAASTVTPLTTFISHTQKTNPQMSVQQATAATATAFCLGAGTDINQDYIAKGKPDLHRVAQLTAALLGETISGVVTAENANTADKKREAMLIAMDYAKTQACIYSKAAIASTDADLKTKIAQATAKAKNAVDGDKTYIAQKIADKVDIKKAADADIATIFKDGIFTINRISTGFSVLSLDYSIQKLEGDKFITKTYTLSDGVWAPKAAKAFFYFDSKTSKWLEEPFSTANLVVSSDGKTHRGEYGNTGFSISGSLKETDVSGKKAWNLSNFLWGSCLKPVSSSICSYVESLVLPASSKTYVLEGYYQYSNDLFYYSKDCKNFAFGRGCEIKTLKEGIDSGGLNSVHGLNFKISKADDSSGTLTFYDCVMCATPKTLGIGKYSISSFGDRKVFRITEFTENSPGSLVSDPNWTPNNYIIVEDLSGIFTGWYQAKGVIAFSGKDGAASNRTALNALFQLAKLPNAL